MNVQFLSLYEIQIVLTIVKQSNENVMISAQLSTEREAPLNNSITPSPGHEMPKQKGLWLVEYEHGHGVSSLRQIDPALEHVYRKWVSKSTFNNEVRSYVLFESK